MQTVLCRHEIAPESFHHQVPRPSALEKQPGRPSLEELLSVLLETLVKK